MPSRTHEGDLPLTAILSFKEKASPLLLDVSSLLYDVELLHDLGVILWYKQYSSFTFSRYFWYRNARPLQPQHRLRARRIELKSPLLVELIFGGGSGSVGVYAGGR